MEYADKTITCTDCGTDFIHSAEDQARYAERGFEHEPRRCRTCREKRKAGGPPQGNRMRSGGGGMGGGGPRRPGGGGPRGAGGGGGGRRPARQMFTAVCSECGQETQVPFKPADGRPVYCRACFLARKESGEGGGEGGGRTAEFD